MAIFVLTVGETRIYARNMLNPDTPRLTEPFTWAGLSVDHFWIPVLYLGTAVGVSGVVAFFVRHKRRTGNRHPAVALYLALFIGPLIDPILNWAMYAVYYPKIHHWPITWAFFSISPSIEPFWVIGAYQLSLIPVCLMVFALYRWINRKASPDSWLVRHHSAGLFVFAAFVGMGFDIALEMWAMSINVWRYTQIAGPYLSFGHANLAFIEIVWVGVIIGSLTVMLNRDDKGQSFCTRLAKSQSLFKRLRCGEVGVAFVVVGMIMFLYGGTFVALRLAGLMKPVPAKYPYTSIKTYDPDGLMEKAGQPGPYFDGIWCTSSHCD